MAETSVLLAGIELKVQKLIAHNTLLSKKVADLTDENEALKSELAELQESHSQLTDQINKKIIVNALGNEKEVEKGRKLIQGLMREIDNCVALLNKG
jgi:predicted RNase H-like nuclease (RuvC/YqgF family)